MLFISPRAAACGIVLTGSLAIANEPLFEQYWLTPRHINRPSAETFDVLPDGRIVTISDAEVFIETAPGSRAFASVGSVVDLNNDTAAFVKASPDGTKLAVGNNGGPTYSDYKIGVFSLADFTGPGASVSGSLFPQGHWEATWYSNDLLVVTAPGAVTELDVTDGTTRTLVGNILGASAGIAFDSTGALYTGNGYDIDADSTDETGHLRRFSAAQILGVDADGLDFEAEGQLVADILTGNTLAFDTEGNLMVGGGDLFGTSGDFGYVGIIASAALADVISGSSAPIDMSSPATALRKFTTFNSSLVYNPARDEIYTSGYGSSVGGVIAIPEPALVGLIAPALIALRRRRA